MGHQNKGLAAHRGLPFRRHPVLIVAKLVTVKDS